ncbi:unnamed protein product, partial [Laminaria digitata]
AAALLYRSTTTAVLPPFAGRHCCSVLCAIGADSGDGRLLKQQGQPAPADVGSLVPQSCGRKDVFLVFFRVFLRHGGAVGLQTAAFTYSEGARDPNPACSKSGTERPPCRPSPGPT